jgi:hypothetical protein
MAFKDIQDTSSGEQFKFTNFGDTLTGVYLGTFDHQSEKYGSGKKHLFKTETGVKVVFNQKHLIDLLRDFASPGQLVRVTYYKDKAGSRNPMKMYKLAIDDEFKASEDEINASVEAATSEENADYADEVEAAPVTRAAKPLPAARAPDPAKVARVQSLLNGGRKST